MSTMQEARKLAISRPVEMDKLEDGVQQSVATVNVRNSLTVLSSLR